MSEKILLNPIRLKYQKPTDVKECFIELFKEHLYYKLELWADEPVIDDDEDSGWVNVYNKFDIVALKKNIAGIEKHYTKDEKWAVYIRVNGFANDLRVYYRTEAPAQ